MAQCTASVMDVHRLILSLTDSGDCTPADISAESAAYLKEKLEILTPGECEMTNLAMEILRMALDT
ncbi:MAG: hypothetical protein ABFD46_05965 [Armatimonadota bacterium]